MEHLLQPTDLGAYARPVSRHMDEDTANTYIVEAESLDVRPAIGDALFRELIAYPEKWENNLLLEGGWYPSNGCADFGPDYQGEKDAYFKGLKSAAAYYTLAHIVKGNDAQITRYGLVNKDADYSTRPSAADRNAAYRDLASVGDQYLAETLKFLSVYASKYPKAKGARVIKNNRTKYRVIGE